MLHILLLLICTPLLAAPQSLEVWFLSQDKKTAVIKQTEDHFIFSLPTVSRQCDPVGDYCFDPQYGLYKPDNEWEAVHLDDTDKLPGIAPTGFDRDLIDCDKKNGFDIFCGKASPVKAPQFELEVWIDTSGSMREFDFTDEHGGCYRKSLITRLDDQCRFGKKLNVIMFDTSIKEVGSFDSLCINNGLNSTARMIDWIERSDAKKVVIITDINEYTKEFSDYLSTKNAKLRGEKGDLSARSLLSEVSTLARMCK
ncbi:MAG: hypothetical protein WCY48_09265 [Candidatus Caldatribacteriota bacterium]